MTPQTIEILNQSAVDAHSGTKPFPQIVGDLLKAGVSRYTIDFERDEETFYLQNGESHRITIEMPDVGIAEGFDKESLIAAIRDSQTQGQKFPQFLVRAFHAGCVGYTAFLDGRRVIYWGRLGDCHTEHFPE